MFLLRWLFLVTLCEGVLVVCLQELYSGGKDCNILAWVPVLRAPDVEEEEPNGENKVQIITTRSRVG